MIDFAARLLDAALEATVAPSFTRVGIALRSSTQGWTDPEPGLLRDRSIVVTGTTSGIGFAIAQSCAQLGAEVHVVARDSAKLASTARDLRRFGTIVEHVCDLASLDQVQTLADELVGLSSVDALIHNAGALVHDRTATVDGNELTAQVHVIAPFLLTALLLPALRRSDHARVITMSSGGMYTQKLDVAALIDPPDPFNGTVAYAQAKRAQVELNVEWARRHSDEGIGFHAMHPGWVSTPGLDTSLPGFAKNLRAVLRSPEQGADTAVWLTHCAEAESPGGRFWHDRRLRHRSIGPTSTQTQREDLWRTVAARAGC